MEKDDEARSAAVGLIARGLITPGQAAELAGVSRQLVHYWLKQHGIQWQATHQHRVVRLWRREIAMLRGEARKPPSKKELRRQARAAKAKWDREHATELEEQGPPDSGR